MAVVSDWAEVYYQNRPKKLEMAVRTKGYHPFSAAMAFQVDGVHL